MRDDDGFVLTGAPAGASNPFETSVAGVYAAGDVRSGSIKRCATAVGEGANVVSLIHTRVAASTVVTVGKLEFGVMSSTKGSGSVWRMGSAARQ